MTHDHHSSNSHIASPRYGDMNKSSIDCANNFLSTSDDNDRNLQKSEIMSVSCATTIPDHEGSLTSSSMPSKEQKNHLSHGKRSRQIHRERSVSRSCSITASSSSTGKQSRSFSRSSSRQRTLPYDHRKHKRSRDQHISHKRSNSPCLISYRSRSNSSLLSKKSAKRRNPYYSPLPLEWWERSEECKEAKLAHVDKIDWLCSSREFLVLQTTLLEEDTALEPNMFPCKHSTL